MLHDIYDIWHMQFAHVSYVSWQSIILSCLIYQLKKEKKLLSKNNNEKDI